MSNISYEIFGIDASELTGFRTLRPEDISLVRQADVSQTFDPTNHFVELSFFTLNNVRINSELDYRGYSILSGGARNDQQGTTQLSFNVQNDYEERGYRGQDVKVLYNFLNYVYSEGNNPQDFYIESISPDRKELRLISVNLDQATVGDRTNTLIERYEDDLYVPDIYAYFGNNIFFNVVNIDSELYRNTTAVLLKLYEPLPRGIQIRSKVNLIERISNSLAYEVNVNITPDEVEVPYLRGPNYSAEVPTQAVEPSKYFCYDELFSFPVNNTYRELNALLNEKGAELGIDYSDFSFFINFSSAEERLRNFKYKLDLIESYQGSLDLIEDTSNNYTLAGISGSRAYYEGLLDGVVNNFDHYERHLYFQSGSTSWPKTNTLKPFINQLSTTEEAETWYLGELNDAVLYDSQNQNLLTNTIPTFIEEDQDNRPFELFIHMIGQHFDNLWIYTDAVSKKYDADNRLKRGVSKDLIEDLLKNFGVKLYTSNKSLEDLFKYFTFSGYDFGNEIIQNNYVVEPTDITSEKDYQKQIYKRIYHNLSLLMKTKGTERGLRALINCFGIPSNILKIRVFGGKDRNNLPFFGGEREITGSIDKVRLNNTGSIVPGNTTSLYTSILKENNDYTQDLHRIEVGFSPTYNVDDYIISQSAVLFPDDPFNIDQYIGDPRGYESDRYFDLHQHAKIIFENVEAYDVKDFVRLIKFFDNVIFRMVRDFVPARAVTDTGIIIKSHLLERNKFKDPRMTWTQPEYTGSFGNTGFASSSNAGSFSTSGFYSVDGELITSHRRVTRTPEGSKAIRLNNFDLDGTAEKQQIRRNFEEAKYDGEFAKNPKNPKGLRASNGNLTSNNPYLQINYPTITYNVQFYSEIPTNICVLQTEYSGPFIVNPNTTLNLTDVNIFEGDNSTYLYTVDGQSISPPTFTFTGEQYAEFEIVATHPDNPLENLLTGESTCQGTRVVKIVQCGINGSQGVAGIGPLSINTSYNFYNFFFNEPVINSELSYFVNDVFIGTTSGDASQEVGEEGTPTNFVFTDTSLSSVRIRVQDTFDPSCFREFTKEFNPCALADLSAPLSDEQANIIFSSNHTTANTSIQQIYDYSPNEFFDFYTFPFNLAGINNTTNVFFQIQVIYRDPNFGRVGTPAGTSEYQYFLSNEVQIDNPLPDSIISTVPNSYAEIVNIFGNTGGNGLLEPLSPEGGVIYYEVNPDPYQLASESGNYQELYYDRQIRFIADNGIINSLACRVVSRWYSISKANLHRVAVELYYFDSTYQGAGVNLCLTANTRTVYVEVFDTVNTVTQDDVIQGGMYIYANDNPNSSTPAPEGMYGDDGSGNFEPYGGGNYNGVPQFALGRRGRVWFKDAEDVFQWDTTTTGDQNVEYIDYGFNGIPGLFVCNYDGIGSTDDNIGFEDAFDDLDGSDGNIGGVGDADMDNVPRDTFNRQ